MATGFIAVVAAILAVAMMSFVLTFTVYRSTFFTLDEY